MQGTRVLSIGSVAAAVSLVVCGLSVNTSVFLAGLNLVELASAFVLYSTAFALLAQTTGRKLSAALPISRCRLRIEIFWPLTTWMLQGLNWHQVYFVFAGLHVVVCLPLHLGLTRFARIAAQRPTAENAGR